MSKRNLFVSFAESDGGHSYLAARAMLDPGSIAHLIFRNSVAESLEAVAAGQANYAIVPSYNSITQWDGATLKGLSSGQFEICAQVCMPTSYVLVAHKDYMSEFVNTYLTVKAKDPTAVLTQEEEAKIYTRFLSRIFVGAQAEEQYRGRLIRPDMTHATVELSRNPLRILEQLTRTDLLKAMTATPRQPGGQPYPPGQQAPSQISMGGAPILAPVTQLMAPAPVMEMLQAPAAMVASGLLDAPGDPDGWDQPGSLGEIVALLRKLLVLLNVYSFGSPDLPENKTQYLLLGRRGAPAPPADAIRSPVAAPRRMMALVRPSLKKSSADQWVKPRDTLTERVRDFGYVFDRPPLMLAPGNQRIFLFEGGHPKDPGNPISAFQRGISRIGDLSMPRSAKDKTLRKAVEKKPDGDPKDDTPRKFDTLFLGQYPTWCHGLSDEACWCCEEAHRETRSAPFPQFLAVAAAGLLALAVLAFLFYLAYCTFSGSCRWSESSSTVPLPPPIEVPPTYVKPPETIAPLPPNAVPTKPSASEPATDTPYPGLSQKPSTVAPATRIVPVAPPRVQAPKPPPVFHVAYFEAKWNLTPEAMNALSSAASQAMQLNKTITIRVVALGSRETDDDLWRRRLYAVKDELVRLGVPAGRISYDGTGPYVITIRSKPQPRPTGRQRLSYDLDSVDDPLSGD